MKKIIVVGYPKSGNTWISRLTAELVGCPVEGFLYSDHEEIAVEGLSRVSEYALYKSHHQLNEINEKDLASAKLIYVIRDPRDIAISGRSFFLSSSNIFSKVDWSKTGLVFRAINNFKAGINIMYHRSFGKRVMKNKMNKAVIYGNNDIHHWCRISWKNHLIPYLKKSNVLKIKYESALNDPLMEAKRILEFIGVEKNEKEIVKIIENQSFSKKKKQFLNENQSGKARFLRKGKGQQWRGRLSKKENQMFINSVGNELVELNYDLE